MRPSRLRLRPVCTLFALSGLLATQFVAAMPFQQFTEIRDAPGGTDLAHAYVAGMGEGLLWTNVLSLEKHGKVLFCEPPELQLNGSNFVTMLDQQVEHTRKQGKNPSDMEVGALLSAALERVFPCATVR